MEYLTKTEFKEIVEKSEKLRAYSSIQSRLELWSEGIFNFIDMEPGIIYIKEIKGSSPTIQYLTLNDSSINREWVRIYNSTTITTLNAPMNCEIYSYSISVKSGAISKIAPMQSGLTYGLARGLKLNGYSDKALKIYTWSYVPPFMNWTSNPLEGN